MNLPLRIRFRIVTAATLLALGISVAADAGPARQVQTFQTSAGPVEITPIYHASVLVQAGGKNIYVDPVRPGNFNVRHGKISRERRLRSAPRVRHRHSRRSRLLPPR